MVNKLVQKAEDIVAKQSIGARAKSITESHIRDRLTGATIKFNSPVTELMESQLAP